MGTTDTRSEDRSDNARDELPFLAPCRKLSIRAPFRWLAEGLADFRVAPRQSLLYGLAMVAIYLLLGVLGNYWGGFVIPLAIMGKLAAITVFLRSGAARQDKENVSEQLRTLPLLEVQIPGPAKFPQLEKRSTHEPVKKTQFPRKISKKRC